MTELRWISCDVVTGRIIEELPDLKVSGGLSDALGAISTAQFTLPIPLPGADTTRQWEGATEPGRVMLVALDPDDQPFWGGIVTRRRGGTGPTLQLSTTSLHGYLNRRYVGDHEWSNADDTSVIAAGLLADAAPEGINLVVDAPPSGKLRDRTYKDKDNKTVYRALTELSGVIDGPEWTIDLAWQNADQNVITKTVRIRPRIGVAALDAPTAVFTTTPSAVFDTTGEAAADYDYDEDVSEGKGANHVLAYSSGQGQAQPFSDPARDETLLAAGWPRYEHRFQPSSSITDVSTLNSHAQARLAVMRLGGRAWVIEARWSQYPRLGRDWRIGDDIGWDLVGHRHPNGVQGMGRAIGWDVDPDRDRVRLILWQPEETSQ